jgi:hypothetical protein
MTQPNDRVEVRARSGHADSESGIWRSEGETFSMSAARAELKASEGFVEILTPAAHASTAHESAAPEEPASAPAPAPAVPVAPVAPPAPERAPVVPRRKRDAKA